MVCLAAPNGAVVAEVLAVGSAADWAAALEPAEAADSAVVSFAEVAAHGAEAAEA